jgi:alpha-beta hydrolase superfamily lysophospholipase
VAFDVYARLTSQVVSGVVFVSPMTKIKEDMVPHPFIIKVLHWLLGSQGTERLIGLFPLAPSCDLSSLAYRLEDRRRLAHCIPLIYSRKPRLTTARELLLTTQRLSGSLKNFDAPFLVLHGLDDKITDPKLSQALYDEACSLDKTIKLYEGMCHTLTSGEPAENLDIVFADMIRWIESRM